MARYYGVPLRNGLPIGLGSAISLRKPGGAAAAVPDPYFEYTTLLLPGNGTNGAQNNTFLDSSTNNFTITRNGNTTQGTFSPFSQTGWGSYWNGTASSITFTKNTSTSDVTLECWFYRGDDVVTRHVLFGGDNSNSANNCQFSVENSGAILVSINATTIINAVGTAVAKNQWNHVAFVRVGTGWTVYVNGTSVATGTSGNAINVDRIGNVAALTGHTPNGYISNARIVDSAVYTGNFTPSTTPLTAITNTYLLTLQSNRFVDNSANARALTLNGTISIQAFSPFNPTAAWSAATNGGSGYFDGSGDYLTLAPGAAFAFGTGDFTVEAWAYVSSTGGKYIIDARNSGQTGAWAFGIDLNAGGNNRLAWYTGSTTIEPTTELVTNAWNHCVYVRSGTTYALFLNGTRIGTGTDSTNYSVSPTTSYVGSFYNLAAYFNGYLANVRTVKGTAVYSPSSTTLTVPTAPLTAITNTSFLLNFTNGAIYDATSKNDLETVGNAQISTTQSKFGGSSMYFDGTGDCLLARNNTLYGFGTGDFTIEAWVYVVSGTSFANVVAGPSGGATWYLEYSSNRGFYFYDGTNALNGSASLVTGAWKHLAVSRSGSTLRMFVDGTLTATHTTSSNVPSVLLAVGAYNDNTYNLNGYVDDLRITKGYARYTANFTPPTAAFPLL